MQLWVYSWNCIHKETQSTIHTSTYIQCEQIIPHQHWIKVHGSMNGKDLFLQWKKLCSALTTPDYCGMNSSRSLRVHVKLFLVVYIDERFGVYWWEIGSIKSTSTNTHTHTHTHTHTQRKTRIWTQDHIVLLTQFNTEEQLLFCFHEHSLAWPNPTSEWGLPTQD